MMLRPSLPKPVIIHQMQRGILPRKIEFKKMLLKGLVNIRIEPRILQDLLRFPLGNFRRWKRHTDQDVEQVQTRRRSEVP